MKKSLRGITLTELAIVLGAMGLLMGAVWTIAGTVWDSYKFRKTNQQLQTVAQAMQDYYGNLGKINLADVDITTNVDTIGLIPADMRMNRTVAGNLVHANGGAFLVMGQNSGKNFRLRVQGLKKETCIRMLIEFPVAVPEMGVTRIGTQTLGLDVNANDIVATSANFPLSPSTAATWCNNVANNEVYIDFKVRK